MLADIIKEISNNKCTLIAVDSKVHRDRTAETNLTIEVENLNVLNTVVKALRKIDSVYEVNRKNRYMSSMWREWVYQMILKRIKIKTPLNEFTNCYIVQDENTKETMVIDPGGEFEKYKKCYKQ